MTAPAITPPPASTAYAATHLVPPEGLWAWSAPDPASSTIALAGGLDVQFVQGMGGWAQVRASNGWLGWVDGGRLLRWTTPRPPITKGRRLAAAVIGVLVSVACDLVLAIATGNALAIVGLVVGGFVAGKHLRAHTTSGWAAAFGLVLLAKIVFGLLLIIPIIFLGTQVQQILG